LKERLRYGDLISYDGDPTSPVEKLRYRTLQASELRMERLNFGSCTRDLRLPFADSCFDKVIASLLLSYLPNPEYVSREFFRLLKPGGSILASSMKPDSDISTIYTTYIQDLQSQEPNENTGRDRDLMNARIMLNEAAGLLQLEEEGYFRFYNAKELQELVECAGFHVIEVLSSLGSPSQAVIVIAKKPY
jgi:ubiquinone/menaquinone biosynthesis C-methylase UbiE